MERMDSEDFVVTEDNDATVEELSGDHSESREVPAEDDNVIQVTDGEEDMGEEGSSSSEEETEPLVTLTRKKKEPSPVWECGAIRIEGGTKCTLCGKEFICQNHNTSNIIRHIVTLHKKQTEGKKLAEMIKAKKNREAEKKKTKKAKVDEKHKVRQSSMKNFLKKVYIDPLKKKRVDESIVKLILVENELLQLVEKHSFRELLHTLEPGYICPSRRTLTKKIEDFSEQTLVELKKEVEKDLKDVEDKVISVTSDHGTSLDRFRTHKNAVTISRCTKDFGIKTDTVGLIKCDGSQTGKVIRGDVRDMLQKVGLKPDWIINWTTDGEAKQVSARGKGKHPEVGMDTHLTGVFQICFKQTHRLGEGLLCKNCFNCSNGIDLLSHPHNISKNTLVDRQCTYGDLIFGKHVMCVKDIPEVILFLDPLIGSMLQQFNFVNLK